MRREDFVSPGEALRYQARHRPEHVAIISGGRRVTYSELDRRSDRLAHAMAAHGVAPQDRVAVLAKNGDRFLQCFFAASKAAAVFMPISWRLTCSEIAAILEDAGAKLLFVDAEYCNLVSGLDGLDRRSIVLIEGWSPGFVTLDGFVRDQPSGLAARLPGPEEIALQIYTSGTTGLPKGVMLSNRNLAKVAGLDAPPTPPHFQMTDDAVVLVSVPLFHIGGLEAALRPLFHGGTVVLHRGFDPSQILLDIPRSKITHTSLVPTALQMLIEHEDAAAADFSSLKIIYYGAAPIAIDLVKRAMAVLGCQFAQSYGMTEATGTICSLPPSDHHGDSQRMLSAGLPLPGVELRILDDEGHAQPPGALGEIAVRAPSVMEGYWRNSAATSDVIIADGWLRTGDAGYLDADGYLYIRDRVKDMIVSGAENIYPAEIEKLLMEHPLVADAAVIGVPDRKWGEAVKAVVVPRDPSLVNAVMITEWLRARIAGFKVPRSVEFTDELPRNASGKIVKAVLRAHYSGSPATP